MNTPWSGASLAEVDINAEFTAVLDRLEATRDNLFITGKAGTGKSTLLQIFRQRTQKRLAVLAPTGVAALNVRGQTIHSFFGFKPDVTPQSVTSISVRRHQLRLYQSLEILIIDEVSMVRADLLDCVDAFLRIHGPQPSKSFGGVQMVFFGDLFQLPPVVTRAEASIFRSHYASPYFFDAHAYPALNVLRVELKQIYRQKEERFIGLLSAIREKSLTPEDLTLLNSRWKPDFIPEPDAFTVYLTTTNALADQINAAHLEGLKNATVLHEGEISGDFERRDLPTQSALKLKIGAQVMLLNNDAKGRWVNGTIGKITYLDESGYGAGVIEVALPDGNIVEVSPFTWEMFRFSYNEESGVLESQPIGSFRQYPLRLAWAVTIHKSQGKTFPQVVIDIGTGTFSPGQLYVALSRCERLEGIVLKQPIYSHHVLLDRRVQAFSG